jgi:hypothetical protein
MEKYWPNDPPLNCSTNANFKDYIKAKLVLGEKNYELIENFEYLKS